MSKENHVNCVNVVNGANEERIELEWIWYGREGEKGMLERGRKNMVGREKERK